MTASIVRSCAVRMASPILENACSIGVGSGLQAGRNHSFAFAARKEPSLLQRSLLVLRQIHRSAAQLIRPKRFDNQPVEVGEFIATPRHRLSLPNPEGSTVRAPANRL